MSDDNSCELELSRDTFKRLDSESRDAIIFDCLKTVTQDIRELKKQAKIDEKKIVWIGALFGFLGGICAFLCGFILP